MGFGTGMMIQGGAAGLRDVRRGMEHDEDRAYQKEDREYQRKARELDLEGKQVGLQDTRDRMARQKVTQARDDEEYAMKKEQAEFFRELDDAIRHLAITKDPSKVTDLYSRKWPDEGQAMSKMNKDGTYDLYIEKDGQTQMLRNMSFDDFGTLAMQMRDPGKWLEDKKASAAKASERAHELNKMKLEYNLKGQLEAFKAGIDPEKTGKVPQYQKELASMAARSYGSMNGDMMSLDENTRQSAGYVAFLATKFYERGGKGDINESHLRAMQTVDRLVKVAEQQAQQSGGDFDAILDDLITTEAASSMRDAPQPTSAPSLDVFVKKFLEVNKGATEADAKAFYEQKYGQAADAPAPSPTPQKPAAGLQPPSKRAAEASATDEDAPQPTRRPLFKRSENSGLKPLRDWEMSRAVKPIADALEAGKEPTQAQIDGVKYRMKRLNIDEQNIPPEIAKYLEAQ